MKRLEDGVHTNIIHKSFWELRVSSHMKIYALKVMLLWNIWKVWI